MKGESHMKKIIKPITAMNLHLFDGGDGGASSSAAAVTGNSSGTLNDAGSAQPATGENAKQDAAAKDGDVVVTSPDDKARIDFENYIKGEGKQFFDERVQKIINSRFKQTKTLEENARKLEPMLNMLSEQYGVDVKDLDGLAKAFLDDNRMYEERARENGVSVEVQKKWDRLQMENNQLRASDEQRRQNEETQRILQGWQNQSEELKKEFPDFDFNNAIQNRDFHNLVVNGIPLRNAYIAAFPDAFGKKVEKTITDNIKARGNRPNANSNTSSASASEGIDVFHLTPAQRRNLANRAAAGEKIML